MPKEIEAAAVASIAEVRAAAAEAVAEVRSAVGIVGQPLDSAALALESYLTQVPAAVRRSLRRPDAPAGTTLPPRFTLRTPEDLLRFLPDRPARFRPGDRVPGINRVLVELLGTGGFGEVRKGQHPTLKGLPPVPLKFCLDPEAAQVLRHEAALLDLAMRQGRMPGVVELKNAYLDTDPVCLEYEYVAGGDLAGLLVTWQDQKGEARAVQAARVVRRLATTVGHFHRLDPPIVHRDLKPANILVSPVRPGEEPHLCVADFGIGGLAAQQELRQLGRAVSRGEMMVTSLRGSHTPLYASPQQRAGAAPDPRDDVHALGVIWYQLLTGDLRHGPGVDYADELRDLAVSEAHITLLGQCVASRAERRPADAGVLAERLAEMREATAHIPPPGPRMPGVNEGLPIVPGGIEQGRSAGPTDLFGGPMPARQQGLFKGDQRPHEEEVAKNRTTDEPGSDAISERLDTEGKAEREPEEYEEKKAAEEPEAPEEDEEGDFPDGPPIDLDSLPDEDIDLTGLGELTRGAPECPQKTTVSVRVRGDWYARPFPLTAEREDAEWEQRATTPGQVVLDPYHQYRFVARFRPKRGLQADLKALAEIRGIQGISFRHSARVADEVLASIGGMPDLTSLDLYGCKHVTDAGLAVLPSLRHLEDLDLSRCTGLTDNGLSCLGSVPTLRRLSLGVSGKGVTDAGMGWLASCPNLELFHLPGNLNVTDVTLARLPTLNHLKTLCFPYCGVTDSGMARLRGLPQLRQLSLGSCRKVTGEGISHLAALRDLEKLDLSGLKKLTDVGIGYLNKHTKLRTLTISNCEAVTERGLRQVGNLIGLFELGARCCPKIGDEGLAQLQSLTELRGLMLGCCKEITDTGLRHLGALGNLKRLDLGWCKLITDAGLRALTQLQDLEELVLWGCHHITDEGLAALGEMVNLTSLVLHDCDQLTDRGLNNLCRLPRLREVGGYGCGHVTGGGMRQLQAAVPGCRVHQSPVGGDYEDQRWVWGWDDLWWRSPT